MLLSREALSSKSYYDDGGDSIAGTENDRMGSIHEDTTSDTSSIAGASFSHGSGSGSGVRKGQGMIINRLKAEIAMLRESLEAANSEDIVLLTTKLRGAKEDIARLKSRNNEFKDRIQILEGSLHNALQTNQQLREQVILLQRELQQATKDKQHAEDSNNPNGIKNGIGTNNPLNSDEDGGGGSGNGLPSSSPTIIRSNPALRRALLTKDKTELENRCNHLTRLNAALQGRIDEMQILLDSYKNSHSHAKDKDKDSSSSSQNLSISTPSSSSSSSSKVNKINDTKMQDLEIKHTPTSSSSHPSTSTDKKSSRNLIEKINASTDFLSIPTDAIMKVGSLVDSLVSVEHREEVNKEIAAAIARAREYDLKTIGELAKEVKRLSIYAPAETDESQDEEKMSENGSTVAANDDDDVQGDGQINKDTTEENMKENLKGGGNGQKHAPVTTSTNKSQKKRQNDIFQLLCAFFCGVIAMCLSTAFLLQHEIFYVEESPIPSSETTTTLPTAS